MNVVGLDISLTSSGVALPNGNTLRLRTKLVGMERLSYLRAEVWKAVASAELVAIEGYSFGSKGSSVYQIGELGGVIRLMLWSNAVPYVEVPPSSLKRYATGKGNANKDEMLAAAIRRFGYEGSSNDEADAMLLRHMALTAYGEPLVNVPETHLVGMNKIDWPKPVIGDCIMTEEPQLAESVADEPLLGLATTRQLLLELAARFEFHGPATSVPASGMHELLGTLPAKVLDYRLVDSQ